MKKTSELRSYQRDYVSTSGALEKVCFESAVDQGQTTKRKRKDLATAVWHIGRYSDLHNGLVAFTDRLSSCPALPALEGTQGLHADRLGTDLYVAMTSKGVS